MAYWIDQPEPDWTLEMVATLELEAILEQWAPELEALVALGHHAASRITDLPPTWRYLEMLGVDPVVQGSGYGGVLLRQVLADAYAAGQPLTLMTGDPANVGFYQHHGLTVAWQGTAPDGVLPMWSLRTPYAADNSR